MKVLFIGNYYENASDGQSLKTITYLNIFKKEGIDYSFINTYKWQKHFVSIYFKIKKEIKKCDVVLLMLAFRGAKHLIPLINKLKDKKQRIIYSMIGTGPLAIHIRSIGYEKGYDFVVNHQYDGYKEDKMALELSKLDYILPETDLIKNLYEDFYGLKNCITVTNFRLGSKIKKSNINNPIRLIYLSRIVEEKGVFDLIEAVTKANSVERKFQLDIFGNKNLSSDEEQRFHNLLSDLIVYKGVVSFDKVIETISRYDLFCFPTRCPQEGTPGVLVESLIAGTPVLASKFPQVKQILLENVNSIFYEFGSKDDLYKSLVDINKDKILFLSKGTYESASIFTYEANRSLLLSILKKE